MKQCGLIKYLGGRKFIVAQLVLAMAFAASVWDKMNPMLASILAGVGLAYGACNLGTKIAGKQD